MLPEPVREDTDEVRLLTYVFDKRRDTVEAGNLSTFGPAFAGAPGNPEIRPKDGRVLTELGFCNPDHTPASQNPHIPDHSTIVEYAEQIEQRYPNFKVLFGLALGRNGVAYDYEIDPPETRLEIGEFRVERIDSRNVEKPTGIKEDMQNMFGDPDSYPDGPQESQIHNDGTSKASWKTTVEGDGYGTHDL